MLKFVLILTLTIGVAVAKFGLDCNAAKCNVLGPKISGPRDMLPDEEQLKSYCPALLALVDCVDQEIQICTMQTFAELRESNNETIAAFANIYMGIGHLFIDLCDDNSAIRKAYVENIACIREVLMDEETEYNCVTKAREVYSVYNTELVQSRAGKKHKECLVAAYTIACAAEEMQKACGEEARATLVDVIKRIKFLKYEVCSPEDIVDLKTNYINFLELESDRRSIFENVFDFRKRK